MARNGSGTHSIPNTLVSGTAITASAHNQNYADVSAELTNSVACDGQSAMTGPLKAANGSAGAPSITFNSDTDSGWYRKAANSVALALEGVDRIVYSTAAASFAIGLIASATATFSNEIIASATATFSAPIKSASTSHWLAPVGTTGQRPTPAEGMFRQNSTTHSFEYYNGTAWVIVNGATTPRGYIDGCILSNGTDTTNDINIAAGVCRDSTNTVDITVTAMAGKQLDANWAPGAAAGMRNSAAGIADGTYHIYAVRTAASETADIYAHTSTTVATVLTALQAETGGASYVYARRIGSIVRLSNAIIQFSQLGDEVLYTTVPAVNGTTSQSTTPGNFLTNVPSGIKVVGIFNISVDHATLSPALYVYSPDVSDQAAADAVAPLGTLRRWGGGYGYAGNQHIRTNTSTQIRAVSDTSNTTIKIATLGYVDPRGKDS